MLAQCELVELRLHAVVTRAGQTLDHAWFPVEGFVSVTLAGSDGVDRVVAQVGSEGMLDTSLALGLHRSDFSCRVAAAGRETRAPGAVRIAVESAPVFS